MLSVLHNIYLLIYCLHDAAYASHVVPLLLHTTTGHNLEIDLFLSDGEVLKERLGSFCAYHEVNTEDYHTLVDYATESLSKSDECDLEEGTVVCVKKLSVFSFVAGNKNVGDSSAYDIMEYYAAKAGVITEKVTVGVPMPHVCLVSIGSGLQWVIHAAGGVPITVIGTGFLWPMEIDPTRLNPSLHIVGLRGPLSKHLLDSAGGDNPILQNVTVSSDPGLLLPMVYPRPPIPTLKTELKEVGFIIHRSDRDAFFSEYPEYYHLLIDNHIESIETFLNSFWLYKRIVSSSLHGIIFSHAYGIPVCGIRITELTGGEFKFKDYMGSIGYNHSKACIYGSECSEPSLSYPGRTSIGDIPNFRYIGGLMHFVDNCWQPSRSVIEGNMLNLERLVLNYLTSDAVLSSLQ